ncbi:conserved hypothetical protein [Ricinus communis]|uniref:TF-B3 domain-containing protein n=1 Tax=Ricinus communis TaxID=3988 RepID=B9T230_RICCO|nr:conserved hypothetical protein [Ricinus communis]
MHRFFKIILGDTLRDDFHDPIQETENAASVKTSSHSLPCLKSKETPPLPFPQPHKSMKLENPTPNINPQSVAGKVEENENMDSQKQRLNGTVSRKRSQFKEAKATAIQRASIKYESKNPFFMSTIQASHIHRDYRMHVPVKFMVKCTKQSRENVMLIVGNRQWPVKMISSTSDGRSKFSAGWLAFARGNSLQVGDICIFELIDGETVLIKVSIFRHVTC